MFRIVIRKAIAGNLSSMTDAALGPKILGVNESTKKATKRNYGGLMNNTTYNAKLSFTAGDLYKICIIF